LLFIQGKPDELIRRETLNNSLCWLQTSRVGRARPLLARERLRRAALPGDAGTLGGCSLGRGRGQPARPPRTLPAAWPRRAPDMANALLLGVALPAGRPPAGVDTILRQSLVTRVFMKW